VSAFLGQQSALGLGMAHDNKISLDGISMVIFRSRRIRVRVRLLFWRINKQQPILP